MNHRIKAVMLGAALTAACAFPAFASGAWENTANGWTFHNDDGTIPQNTWQQIDAKYYYFDENGICLTNTTTPDGLTVDSTGARVWNGYQQFEGSGSDNMYVSTSIKAPLTLESTGLAGCLKLSEAELFDALGKGTPCKRKNDAGLYYTFAQHPGAFFSMEEVTVGKTGVFCFGIYGPFAAFFSCSGSDTITREQLEQTLGTEMEIGEQLFFGERNFANFTYQGYDYTIRECTPEGSFRGDVWVTVLPHTDWEPEQGFFDESGQWISL